MFFGSAIADAVTVTDLGIVVMQNARKMLLWAVITESGGASGGIGNGLNQIAGVGKLKALTAGMGQAGEQIARPCSRYAIAVGVLKVVKLAIAAEICG